MSAIQNFNKALQESGKAGVDNVPLVKIQIFFRDIDTANKMLPEINSMRAALEKKILAWQSAVAKLGVSLGAAEDEIVGGRYGLDPRKPDDKKKIDQANAIFAKYFKSQNQWQDEYSKDCASIAKHIIQMGRPDPK